MAINRAEFDVCTFSSFGGIAGLIFNSLIMKINNGYLGAFPQLRDAFKHLLNLTDENLLSFRIPTLKRGQIRGCYGLDKLGRHVAAMRNPYNIFKFFSFSKNNNFVSKRDLVMSRNNNLLLLLSQLSIV